jgi:hypothetical protein
MLDWIVSLALAVAVTVLGVIAHRKTNSVRRDGRAHQAPWRLVLVACVFMLFLIVVHLANLVGVETGPENSPFGRF